MTTSPGAYRLPAATRLGRVRLQVSDLAQSLAWYERVLGLRVLDRGPARASLGPAGDAPPVLVELIERAGARPVPRRGRLGLYHFAILLPTRADLGRLIRHLADVGERAGMSDHLVSEAIYLSDPDGLGVEVYADRPRSAWRRENGQLVMATAPLDVGSLVAAGTGGWAGLPDGTTIGHVHLFVADLDAAAALYDRGLGFDQTVWSYPGALFLSAGGYHHHLGTNTWAAGAEAAEEDDARLLDWTIVVPDEASAAAAARSIAAAGFAPERLPDGGHAVADPWGTVVRVIAESGTA